MSRSRFEISCFCRVKKRIWETFHSYALPVRKIASGATMPEQLQTCATRTARPTATTSPTPTSSWPGYSRRNGSILATATQKRSLRPTFLCISPRPFDNYVCRYGRRTCPGRGVATWPDRGFFERQGVEGIGRGLTSNDTTAASGRVQMVVCPPVPIRSGIPGHARDAAPTSSRMGLRGKAPSGAGHYKCATRTHRQLRCC